MTDPRAALADELDGLAQLLSKENTGSDAGFDDICLRAAAALRSPSPYSGTVTPTDAATSAVMTEAYSTLGLELTIPQARRIAAAANTTLPRDAERETIEEGLVARFAKRPERTFSQCEKCWQPATCKKYGCREASPESKKGDVQ